MKDTFITEFVNFKVLESTSVDQLISTADILNDFQKKQDGYIDGELVKGLEGNAWCLIYHYENLEKVKVIGERMRSGKVFDEFIPLLVPGSLSVMFYHQLKKW
jgi:hypothetical protein